MSNTFLVKDTFEISGRGLVIAGQVQSGVIKIGNVIEIQDYFDRKKIICITGIEMGDGRNDDGKRKSFRKNFCHSSRALARAGIHMLDIY